MRRRALTSNTPLVIVEGSRDRRALFPLIDDVVCVIAADGKEQVLSAFDQLETPFRGGVMFIVDCDGGLDSRFKGHIELVITTNRDMEADLLLELRALERVALEVLAPKASSPADARGLARDALALATRLAIPLGAAQAAAASMGLPTRVVDARSGKRRKIRLNDLANLKPDLRVGDVPMSSVFVKEIGSLVGWDPADLSSVEKEVARIMAHPCSDHGAVDCLGCLQRAHCNGHHLVDAVSIVLWSNHDVRIPRDALDRALRIAADRSRLPHWNLVRRIRKWEAVHHMNVIVDAAHNPVVVTAD